MACREINTRYADLGYVIKQIKWDDAFIGIEFPNCEDASSQKLQEIFSNSKINKILQQAIIQQYNEIFIYNEADMYQREILAPQVKVRYSLCNLPDIFYPRFKPIVEEDKVWSLNEEDLKIYLGMQLNNFHISLKEYKDFINKVKDLCADFDLREDDILMNPSNIGYNSVLGLRIIDYGLVE